MSLAVSKLNSLRLFLGGMIFFIPFFYFFEASEVLFKSLESKTSTGGDVFNKIKYFPGFKKDIWMMNQSHQGLHAQAQEWDRLAIIIDKTGPVSKAQFLQLPPGELKWEEDLYQKAIDFRVSCYMCHSNGPRAIRPDGNVGSFASIKIAFWNLVMKSYGRVLEHESHSKKDSHLKIPFRHRSDFDNESLKVKSCIKCHHEKSSSGRGLLKRQNTVTMEFMMNKHLMPPSGENLTEADEMEIQKFIKGL